MKAVEIKPDIYWVGGIDWDIRNFHGYLTPRGTTYNSYLIIDEKITLVDTVKHYKFEEMLSRIKDVVDPSNINYIISNHVEMDHSGSLPMILKYANKAKIITSTRGEKGLKRHFKNNFDFLVKKSGDQLRIGKRTLDFVHIPMVHWPDSMVTYSSMDKLLMPNDAFGQHIASSKRFDHEIDWGILKEEAGKYYANIVMPYGGQVKNALESIKELDIDTIAPSHGIIWKEHIKEIIAEYYKWANNESENKALIVYDSMWNSTEKMAYSLLEGLEDGGLEVAIRNLKNNPISDIINDVLNTKLILIGSPTLNNTMLPSVGAFLTYLKGLRPKNRVGFVFGSYGWGGQAAGEIEKILEGLFWQIPIKNVNLNYRPDEKELSNLKNTGRELAKYLKK